MATRTRKTSTKASETPAAPKSRFPTIKVAGEDRPDVLAMRESGMKWDAIAPVVKLTVRECVPLGWVIEVIKDPSLKFSPTAKNIVEARESGIRWGRIALRSGIGEAKARKLYEDATGNSSDSNYVGRGRKFVPMQNGPLPVGYKATHVLVDGKFVPKAKARRTAKPRTKRTAKVTASTE